MASSCNLQTELYINQKENMWPQSGRHILAQFDKETIVVYQAFCPEIADYVVKHGSFGGPKYSFTRMTWVKTNFMWMMYRSGWGKKPNQERTLAIYLSREGFEHILRAAREGGTARSQKTDDVRLQWDPDHSPSGGNLERRAIQLGIRGEMLKKFHEEYIQGVEDISAFVKDQHQAVLNERIDKLMSPSERVYIPSDTQISANIRLSGFEGKQVDEVVVQGGKTDFAQMLESLNTDGACCSELLTKTCQKMTINSSECEGGDVKTREDIVVCLGGAFNPVHSCHVQVVQEAVTWLHENTRFRVIAARLAVAPDGYVKAKCKRKKQRRIKAEHRIRLCELACQDTELIKPYKTAVGSALECGEKVKKELDNASAKVAVIVGADRAMTKSNNAKWNKKTNNITVCIGRKGTSISEIKSAFVEDLKLGVVENPDFYIVEKELDNISSTDVRTALAELDNTDTAQEKSDIIEGIVNKGWIKESVGKYILENLDDLYLKL